MTTDAALVGLLLVVAAYFAGGVPSGYILARRLRKIDIREYGSGNVGASNVTAVMGAKAGVALGAYDCLVKGALPVLIARALGQPDGVLAAVALASTLGHCWSPYIRFTGGRGIGTIVGGMLAFAMFYEIAVLGLALGVVGRLLYRDTGLWTFIAMLALPFSTLIANELPALLVERSDAYLYFSVGASAIALAKRLTANWERKPEGYTLAQVAFNRVLFDRDVSRKDEWTQREPEPQTPQRPSAADDGAGARPDG